MFPFRKIRTPFGKVSRRDYHLCWVISPVNALLSVHLRALTVGTDLEYTATDTSPETDPNSTLDRMLLDFQEQMAAIRPRAPATNEQWVQVSIGAEDHFPLFPAHLLPAYLFALHERLTVTQDDCWTLVTNMETGAAEQVLIEENWLTQPFLTIQISN